MLEAFEYTGLGRGGQQIQKTKEVYAKAVETLVELASLQASAKKPMGFLWQLFLLTFGMIIDGICDS